LITPLLQALHITPLLLLQALQMQRTHHGGAISLLQPFLDAGLVDVLPGILSLAKGGMGPDALPHYGLWVSAINFMGSAVLRRRLMEGIGFVQELIEARAVRNRLQIVWRVIPLG
jgi:hypothetical protein